MSKLTAMVVPISLAILSVRGSVVAFGIRGGSSLLRIFPLLFAYMSSTDRMTSRNCRWDVGAACDDLSLAVQESGSRPSPHVVSPVYIRSLIGIDSYRDELLVQRVNY